LGFVYYGNRNGLYEKFKKLVQLSHYKLSTATHFDDDKNFSSLSNNKRQITFSIYFCINPQFTSQYQIFFVLPAHCLSGSLGISPAPTAITAAVSAASAATSSAASAAAVSAASAAAVFAASPAICSVASAAAVFAASAAAVALATSDLSAAS
jgi:hypothetical protein